MLCHACRVHVTPRPPKTVWKVLTVAFWIGSLVVASGFSLALGLNLLLAPAAIFIGMSVGTSARMLSSWTCPRCNAELIEPDVTTEPSMTAPPAVPAPSHA